MSRPDEPRPRATDAAEQARALVPDALRERLRALDGAEDWSPARERRLVDVVFARTTRLDPGWRGDLRLVGAFVRGRVAASPYLRAAAAILLVHCFVVLPALAWALLRQRPEPPHFFTGLVPPPEAVAPDEPREQLELVVPEGDLGAEATRLDRQENLRRRARFRLLSAVGLPAPRALGAEAEPAAVLFQERLRLRRGEGVGRSLGELLALARAPVERELLTLVALDRGLVLGRPIELGPLLNELALAEVAGTLGPLGGHVLARARAQGDWPGAAPAGVEPPAEAPLPLGPDEEAALRAAFGDRLANLRGTR